MTTDSRDVLHQLIDQLTDKSAAEALTFVTRLAAEERTLALAPDGGPLRAHLLPVLRPARVVTDPEKLSGDVFPPEESADDFVSTIRRWRDEGQPE